MTQVQKHVRARVVPFKAISAIAMLVLLIAIGVGMSAGPSLAEKDQAAELYLTILHTNDEHSALLPHSPAIDHDPGNADDPTIGGFARLATAIAEIREEKADQNEPVLLFNAGDFLGGTAFGWLAPAGYAAELVLMQAMGYDAVTIGNHEYDYGPEVLVDYLLAAGYPQAHDTTAALASNTRPPAEHPLSTQGLLRDLAFYDLDNGITVGAFSLLGSDAESVTSDTGLIEFTDRLQTAQEMVAALRAQGADIVVAITHAGVSEDRELARGVAGIDVIVGGHCHTALYEPIIVDDTIIVQAGAYTAYLGRLELAYAPATGQVRVRNGSDRPFLIRLDGSIPPHPEIAQLVDLYSQALNRLIGEMSGGRFEDILQAVARSEFDLPNQPLQESPIGNFIADAMRLVVQEATGERVYVALQANGSIRGDIMRGTMPHVAGDVSFYDITNTIGLGYGADGYAGYPIVSVYLTGEELRRMLEVSVLLQEMLGDTFFIQYSGLRYSYNPNNAILFTIPFLNQPLPTGRAVTSAEIYAGGGLQSAHDDRQYVTLKRGDERLYHLVTDSYILSFLPMVGEMLPHLSIVPKNAQGEAVPLEHLDELIVYQSNGRQLKLWQTVVEYAAAQPQIDGVPHIPSYYANTMGRINVVSSFPLVSVVYVLPVLLLAGPAALIWRKKRR